MPRDGVQVEPEIAFDRLQKYVGGYRDPAGALVFEILIQHQRLAVRLPNGTSLDLLPPDADGRRASRANVGLAIAVEETASGTVTAMNVHPPGAPSIRLPAPTGRGEVYLVRFDPTLGPQQSSRDSRTSTRRRRSGATRSAGRSDGPPDRPSPNRETLR